MSVFRVVSCNGPQRFTSGILYTSYKLPAYEGPFRILSVITDQKESFAMIENKNEYSADRKRLERGFIEIN